MRLYNAKTSPTDESTPTHQALQILFYNDNFGSAPIGAKKVVLSEPATPTLRALHLLL